MKLKIFIAVALIGIIGAVVAYKQYNKPHTDFTKLSSDFQVTAESLYTEFNDNEEEANAKYLNKVVELSGVIQTVELSEAGEFSISLFDPMFGVICTIDANEFKENKSQYVALNEGDAIVLKGRCDGMLTDVRISKCSIVKK